MCMHACTHARAQSCPTLFDPMDCSPQGSSVHGMFQARILEAGCHFLLQKLFPTQGLSLHLLCFLHWQVGSLQLMPPGRHYASRKITRKSIPSNSSSFWTQLSRKEGRDSISQRESSLPEYGSTKVVLDDQDYLFRDGDILGKYVD